MQAEIAAQAPDYIRDSTLPLDAREALWHAEGDEEDKRELASKPRIRCEQKEGWHQAIKRHLGEAAERRRLQTAWEATTDIDLARMIAGTLPIYEEGSEGQNAAF